MSDHLYIDDVRVDLSKRQWASHVADLSGTEAYGLKNCRHTWGELLAKYLIFDVFDCTRFETLNQVQADCLIGKMSEDLTANC
jgi:hypothetical protein